MNATSYNIFLDLSYNAIGTPQRRQTTRRGLVAFPEYGNIEYIGVEMK
jgi:hypothetical protein